MKNSSVKTLGSRVREGCRFGFFPTCYQAFPDATPGEEPDVSLRIPVAPCARALGSKIEALAFLIEKIAPKTPCAIMAIDSESAEE